MKLEIILWWIISVLIGGCMYSLIAKGDLAFGAASGFGAIFLFLALDKWDRTDKSE